MTDRSDTGGITLVAFGDSITFGEGDPGGGYCFRLSELLTAATGNPYRIINRGVSGETSAQGLKRLPAIIASYLDASRYLILFGMNDARPWAKVPSGLGQEPAPKNSYKANIQKMIELVNAAGKEVVLAKIPIALGDQKDSITYTDPDRGARSKNIKVYNQVIDELSADPNNTITITPPDLYKHFKAHHKDEYFDNVHPNAKGYASLASRWFDALTHKTQDDQ